MLGANEAKRKEMKSRSGLSVKQEKLIAFLLTERTIEHACQQAEIAVVTYWRWMQEKEFIAAYRRARRDLIEGTVSRLQNISAAAIDALERNLTCENPASEIRAATIILEQAAKGVELLDLESRIEELEELTREVKQDESPRGKGLKAS